MQRIAKFVDGVTLIKKEYYMYSPTLCQATECYE